MHTRASACIAGRHGIAEKRHGMPLAKDHVMARRIAHFKLQQVLGKGASGTVHRALDTRLSRPVALKLMKPCANDPKFEERVRQEARVHARLRSPHVVQLHSVGRTSRSGVYMAMELVNGQSLEAVLERGETLEPEEARTLMIQAARGLRDAQRAGVVHRDIKPSNLLLDTDDRLKIVDFGVAKTIDSSDPSITQDGCVVGTPFYMAPEQALAKDVDFRADMYALGCTFFHLLSGKVPFEGSSVLEVMMAHVGGARPSLRNVAPKVPSRLAKAIERAMARDVADRFESYDAMIGELEACVPKAGVWQRVRDLFAGVA
jgi:serine/threonine-protein kinase